MSKLYLFDPTPPKVYNEVISTIVYVVRVDWCCCMVYMYVPAGLYQMSKLYLFSPSSGMDNKLMVLCTLLGSADVVVWCTCSSRLYQMSKLYLFSPSSGLYSCPLAMADGAAQIIEVTKWSIKKKKICTISLRQLFKKNSLENWSLE